jgi:endonuclease I
MTISQPLYKSAASVWFICALFFSTTAYSQTCPAQGTSIFPTLKGQILLDSLVQKYGKTDNISYDQARDIMYSQIDNHDGKVSGIYTGYTITLDPNNDPSTDAYNQNINAEHTWPQSMGASGEPARSDLHHLHPAYSSANSARGNNPFIEIPDDETASWWRYNTSVSTPVADSIDEYSESRGSHPNVNFSGSWEPREKVKGDVARGMFYFYTMYKSQADAANPYFFEVQKNYLRAWNALDSVSTQEYARTCAIAAMEGNEVNPFVIDPTLVDRAYFKGAIGATNVQFSAPLLTFDESQGTLQVEVSITNPNPDTATTVEVVYTGGTATPGEDFDAISTQTLTFPAGSLDRKAISITIIDDELEEEDETVMLKLQNVNGPAGAVINTADTATLTIRDNDGTAPSTAWINEFHYDNDGGDQGEFVELVVNAEFADLTDVTLTLYNGSNGSSYASYSGTDFVKGGSVHGVSFYYVDLPANGLQNGSPDGMSLDIGGVIIQFISYEGTFTAADGPAQGVESTDIGVEQTASSPVGSSLSLAGSGTGYDDFSWEFTETNTKGEENTNQTIEMLSSVEENITIANEIKLNQNYPNPFNPSTVISYRLTANTSVKLQVYDMLGREIAVLVHSEKEAAGTHRVTFDASGLSSGIYIYRLSTGLGEQLTRKMLLMK